MSAITLMIEDKAWRSHRGLQARLTRAADAARRSTRLKGDFSILLAGDKRLKALNLDFRGKDKPTNVLSFPQLDADELTAALSDDASAGQGELLLGDIILAHETCVREAAEKSVTLVNHATHLVVHGTLHLLGYDHVDEHEAETMEALERQVMATLGYADPYALDGVTFDGE